MLIIFNDRLTTIAWMDGLVMANQTNYLSNLTCSCLLFYFTVLKHDYVIHILCMQLQIHKMHGNRNREMKSTSVNCGGIRGNYFTVYIWKW
jgi:hypothetical protein